MCKIDIEALHCGHGKLVIETCPKRGYYVFKESPDIPVWAITQWKRVDFLMFDLFHMYDKQFHRKTLDCVSKQGIKIQIIPDMPGKGGKPKDLKGLKNMDPHQCPVCGGRNDESLQCFAQGWEFRFSIDRYNIVRYAHPDLVGQRANLETRHHLG